MSDNPPPKNKSGFEHPGFEYKGGAKVREFRGGDGWLPYFERWVVIIWLYVLALLGQEMLDLFDRFTRLMVASCAIGVVLIGMHIAFRQSGQRNAVRLAERQRRRWLTGVASTVWMLVWLGVVYAVWG